MDVIPPRHRKKQRNKSNTTDSKKVREATGTKEAAEECPSESNERFSKRELLSNWNKYDDDEISHPDAQHASNFEELLSQPASVGGHFLFNSEKGWESSDDWYNRDDYFQLNLMELSKSLATIPFYLRQNYPKDIFSSDEVDDMDRQAKYQLFKWQSVPKSNNTLNSSSSSGSHMDVKCETVAEPQSGIVHAPVNDDDDLDDLLKITGTGQQRTKTSEGSVGNNLSSTVSSVTAQSVHTTNIAESTDDIQKWLDDVLVLDS